MVRNAPAALIRQAMARHRVPAVLVLLGLSVVSAGRAWAADVELYELPRYQGMRVSMDQDTPDLTPFNMRERAQSAVVQRGLWEFCTAPNYGGVCVPVGPGAYPELPPGLDRAVASVRRASSAAHPGVPERPQPPGSGGLGASPRDPVVLFEGEQFNGPRAGVSVATGNLTARGFNDMARSVEIRSGRWELCQHADYRGECRIFGPGQHLLEGRLRGDLTSLRPVQGGSPGLPGSPPDSPWGRSGIVLYEHGGWQGRSVTVTDRVDDLSALNFNDIVSSVEVLDGRWALCTDPRGGGSCVTLDRGRHEIERAMNDRISSLRPQAAGPGGPGASPRDPVVLFQDDNFSGNRAGVSVATANLADLGFNDAARSVEIRSGRWELCQHASYQGECRIYGPGQHVLEGRLRGGLTSLRPAQGGTSGQPGGPWGRSGIVLYEHGGWQGRSVTVTDRVDHLSSLNFNDIVSSVEVLDGRWELCTDAQGGGQCVTLGRGRHEIERAMNDRITSLRPVR